MACTTTDTLTPQERIVASLSFVESVARRVAASMPHTIDLGDLVQDGMLGLIDAAHRYDEGRGIKFETFAERRVRGAMIDALRKDAWPRGVRRQRRELEAAREALRRETGAEPSLADLAARVGTDETRLGRTIVRINTIESTSMLSSPDGPCEAMLPDVCLPPEAPSPDRVYESVEARERVRQALAYLPPRERRVIALYYFRDVTMKQIGAEIGVNESRVSQLHARAIQRLQKALGTQKATTSLAAFQAAKARRAERQAGEAKDSGPRGVLVPYPVTSRTTRSSSESRNGLASQRQPLSSRKRSASVPATSPVTKITRRASAGELAAIAR
jgi:RNA polymerase sigma factor for flagellar operon FliA